MFYKFPRTPILARHDHQFFNNEHILSASEAADFLKNEITIEEKIDGANLGISFDSDGTIRFQNRGEYLISPMNSQWRCLPQWASFHEDVLFDVLEDRYILFGEWCFAKHSIYYNNLPDYFIAFDVFDTQEQKFFSVRRRNELLQATDLAIVPQIGYGQFNTDNLLAMEFISNYGDEMCEGIYLRCDSEDWLRYRAKIIRPDFSQSIETHWRKKPLEANRLRY